MSSNFHFLVPESLHIKFGFDWPSGFWEKQVLSFVCIWPWTKVKKWPWPSILTYVHFFQLVPGHRLQMFWKINSFHFFLQKSLSYQIWPCRNIGQGQPRVMIYINFVVLHTLMLHAKFQGNWPSGSGEDFFRFWEWRPSWSCDLDHSFKLSFPLPKEAPHEILVKRFKRSLKMWTEDDGPWVYYKLTLWAWRLRWAKKRSNSKCCKNSYKYFTLYLNP